MYFIVILLMSFFTLLPAMEPDAPAENNSGNNPIAHHPPLCLGSGLFLLTRTTSLPDMQEMEELKRDPKDFWARALLEAEQLQATLAEAKESIAQAAESVRRAEEAALATQRALEEEHRPRFCIIL